MLGPPTVASRSSSASSFWRQAYYGRIQGKQVIVKQYNGNELSMVSSDIFKRRRVGVSNVIV
jgi:hypothetical protein